MKKPPAVSRKKAPPEERPAAPEETASSTRERILAAAEKHFAEHGLEHASVRAITQLADANSAAVVYYFGSKEELFEIVLNRCVAALVEPRLRALDALEQRLGGKPVPLADIVRVLAEPYVMNRADPQRPAALYARFYGRMYAEPNDVHRRVVRTGFEELQQRFLGALARRLPQLPIEELTWRLVCILTSLVHVAAGTGSAGRITPGAEDLDDAALMQVLVQSFSGLLSAPAALQ